MIEIPSTVYTHYIFTKSIRPCNLQEMSILDEDNEILGYVEALLPDQDGASVAVQESGGKAFSKVGSLLFRALLSEAKALGAESFEHTVLASDDIRLYSELFAVVPHAILNGRDNRPNGMNFDEAIEFTAELEQRRESDTDVMVDDLLWLGVEADISGLDTTNWQRPIKRLGIVAHQGTFNEYL